VTVARKQTGTVTFRPVTPSRWKDLETLFGERGACGGCWCMWWRMPRSEFDAKRGAGTKRALKALVTRAKVPGLLAYVDGVPAAWCCIAPRRHFPALDRSRILAPVDDAVVWSVVCFFVARPFRRQGLTAKVLAAAVDYAHRRGARVVEGYPTDPRGKPSPDPFVFTGLLSAFERAGFVEVARRSPTRPIMRHVAKGN
jgi:GNAT superfamily N-acetyltransferase